MAEYSPNPANPVMLLSGEFWNGAAARGFAHGFRKTGLSVAEIDIYRRVIRSPALEFRILNRLLARDVKKFYSQEILTEARMLNAGYFFTIKGNYILPDTLRQLHDQGVRTINFFPDVSFNHPELNVETIPLYDHIFTTKKFHLPYLAEMGLTNVSHLDHGFSPLTHRPIYPFPPGPPEEAYQWDISYVGNASPHKLKWLLPIAEAFPGKRIAIVGNGWSSLAQGTALEPFVLGYPISGDGFARFVELSKINLAVHFGPVGERGWEDTISSRTFHVPAAGGFMMHIDSADIRELYADGQQIALFSNPEEMIDRVTFYLNHEAARRSIMLAGHERCWQSYSLDARAATILQTIG